MILHRSYWLTAQTLQDCADSQQLMRRCGAGQQMLGQQPMDWTGFVDCCGSRRLRKTDKSLTVIVRTEQTRICN